MCIPSLLASCGCCLNHFCLWSLFLHEKTSVKTVRHASNAQIMARVCRAFRCGGMRWVLYKYVCRAVLDPLGDSRVIWSSHISGSRRWVLGFANLFRCFWWYVVGTGYLWPCRPFLRNITRDARHALRQRRINAHERFICIYVRAADIFFALSIVVRTMNGALDTILWTLHQEVLLAGNFVRWTYFLLTFLKGVIYRSLQGGPTGVILALLILCSPSYISTLGYSHRTVSIFKSCTFLLLSM